MGLRDGCAFDTNRTPGDNQPDRPAPFDRLSISDFPFPKHEGELTDEQEKLCDTDIALLDRCYDEEPEMMAAHRIPRSRR